MSKNNEETKKEIQEAFDTIDECTKRSLFDKAILCIATLSAFSATEAVINHPEERTKELCSLASSLSLIYLVAQQRKSQKQKYETAILSTYFNPAKDLNALHTLVYNQQTLQKVNWIKWGSAVAIPTLSFVTGNLNFLPACAALMTSISATTIYRNKLLNDQRKIIESGVPKNLIPNPQSQTKSRTD